VHTLARLDLQFPAQNHRTHRTPAFPRLAPSRRAGHFDDAQHGRCEFTRLKNSSMIFGGWPAAGITVGAEINFAMDKNCSQIWRCAIDLFSTRELDSPDTISRGF
jgi:hypothetical protein